MSFTGKVVFISGASSGIGAAAAIEFAKQDADVVIIGRNESKMNNVSKQCEAHGKKPLVIKADVSKDKEAKAAINKTIDKFGKLDILVNNAGIMRLGSILNGNLLESYDEVMSTNLRAVMNLTTLAAPHLIKTKGNIINISSIAGEMLPILPEFMPYNVSKAALNHFTRCSASELAGYGVRVNSISPGPVKTDFAENSGITNLLTKANFKTPLDRVSDSVEIANLILYLSSDKAKGITGSNYVSDNGCLIKSK